MKNDRHDWLRAATKVPLLIAGLAFASAAFAHVFPQKQEPGAGATVASPAQVRVIFDGPLEPSFRLADGDRRERQAGQHGEVRSRHPSDGGDGSAVAAARGRSLHRALGSRSLRRASHARRLRIRREVARNSDAPRHRKNDGSACPLPAPREAYRSGLFWCRS